MTMQALLIGLVQVGLLLAPGYLRADPARDQYECYLWAVAQTGIDPADLKPTARARVVPSTPTTPIKTTSNQEVAGGALVGAAIGGAAGASIGRSGEIATLGVITGLIKGLGEQKREEEASVRRAKQLQQAENLAKAINQQDTDRDASYQEYQQARSACLAGKAQSSAR